MKKQINILILALISVVFGISTTLYAQTLPGRQVGIVNAANGKTVYLSEQQNKGIYSITAYVKNNNKFEETKVFKVGKDYQSSIKSVKYKEWKSSNPENGYFAFNKKGKTLYLPLINKDMRGSDRYIVYQFDGQYFNRNESDGGYWLHPSLRKFENMITILQSKDYLVRIDKTTDGTYRYAAWKNKQLKDMSSKPDIVINKGSLSKNIFRFDNNGYTYTVDKANKKLQVIHDGKTILDQALSVVR